MRDEYSYSQKYVDIFYFNNLYLCQIIILILQKKIKGNFISFNKVSEM